MKQVIVGIYEAGYEQAQLVLREGTGGEFYTIPESGSIPRIKIGADYDKWGEVVMVLLHEVEEMILTRLSCRYECCNDMARDHAAYLFSMRHTQFSDLCAKTSEYITACLPDLAVAWKKWRKGKKKK